MEVRGADRAERRRLLSHLNPEGFTALGSSAAWFYGVKTAAWLAAALRLLFPEGFHELGHHFLPLTAHARATTRRDARRWAEAMGELVVKKTSRRWRHGRRCADLVVLRPEGIIRRRELWEKYHRTFQPPTCVLRTFCFQTEEAIRQGTPLPAIPDPGPVQFWLDVQALIQEAAVARQEAGVENRPTAPGVARARDLSQTLRLPPGHFFNRKSVSSNVRTNFGTIPLSEWMHRAVRLYAAGVREGPTAP